MTSRDVLEEARAWMAEMKDASAWTEEVEWVNLARAVGIAAGLMFEVERLRGWITADGPGDPLVSWNRELFEICVAYRRERDAAVAAIERVRKALDDGSDIGEVRRALDGGEQS